MDESPNITMKDIAKNLGVSVSTVSRALANDKQISKEMTAKVQGYARRHNFIPNTIGEQLRRNNARTSKIIGVIVPQFVHFYFSTVLAGIQEEVSARGYQMIVEQSDEMFEREEKICYEFIKNKVCGVIVSQAKDTTTYNHFNRLITNGIPLVFYDRICTGLDASRVVVDDYTGAFNAVNYLIQTGCRRIAFYGTSMNLEISKNRYNGYKDALLKNKIPVDGNLVRFCDNRAIAEAITPSLLSQTDRPDGFFAVNDDTAIGVLYTAKHMSLSVPQDVSICGFTNGVRAITCDPMLTTVEQRGDLVGKEAADILLNKVRGLTPMDKVERRVVKTRLVIRGTTRQIDI